MGDQQGEVDREDTKKKSCLGRKRKSCGRDDRVARYLSHSMIPCDKGEGKAQRGTAQQGKWVSVLGVAVRAAWKIHCDCNQLCEGNMGVL